MRSKLDVINATATLVMASAAVVVAAMLVAERASGGSTSTLSAIDHPLSEKDWILVRSGGHAAGSPTAPAQLVVFEDFQCPVCGTFERSVLPKIREKFGADLAVTFRHWPLSYHAHAMPMAIAAECAAQQGAFWPFHDRVFAMQSDLGRFSIDSVARASGVADSATFARCRASGATQEVVDRDAELAQQINAPGTPALVLNGVLLGSGSQEVPLITAISKEVEKHSTR